MSAQIEPTFSNRYRTLNVLGQGGMGVVYRALDRLTGEHIALKCVTIDPTDLAFATQSDSFDYRVAIAQEFRVLSRLRHPNIISVLDYGFTKQNQPYFTMELLEGAVPISAYAKDQPRRVQIDLIVQVLHALSYLHRNGIVHRDLKPDNIVVINGRVKVLDFGLAVSQENLRDDENPVGTIAYIAPEVLQGRPASPASDLYTLGIIACEIFSGKHPLKGKTNNDTIQNVLFMMPDVDGLDIHDQIKAPLFHLVSKDPTERHYSAAELIQLYMRNTHQPELPEIRESLIKNAQLVGRGKERQQLSDALQNVLKRQVLGSAWLIAGESGVGKSRLMEEIRTEALVAGARVVKAQSIAEGGQQYYLWRDILRVLCLDTEIDTDEIGVLSAILPDIGMLTGVSVKPPSASDPQNARERLLTVITDLFKRQTEPLVILLEDLQWAQSDDLDVLRRLNAIVSGLPLMIVGNFRDDERADLPQHLPNMTLIRLRRFTPREIREMTQSILGTRAATDDIQALLEKETEGNAFFIVEVIRTLAEDAGQLDRIGQVTLPPRVFSEGVKSLVQRRLRNLPLAFQPLLQVAAVAGRQLNLPLLARFAEGVDLDAWLTANLSATILEVNENQWQFVHDKLRDGVLATLTDTERQNLHRQIALALEDIADNPHHHALILGYHWTQAGHTSKAAYYYAIAGQQALQQGIYNTAQTLLEQAIAHENDATEPDMPDKSQLRAWLGEALYGLGNYHAARDYLEESILLDEQHNQPTVTTQAHNLLGNIALAFGEYDRARSALVTAIGISLEHGDLLQAGKATRSLGVVAESENQVDEAETYYRESLAILTKVDDAMGIAGAYSNLANLANLRGDYNAAQPLFEEALKRFRSINFKWGIAFTLTSMGRNLKQLPDCEGAIALHDQALNICREIGHRWGIGFVLMNRADAEICLERFESAQESIAETLQIAQMIQVEPLALDALYLYAQTVHPDEPRARDMVAFVAGHDRTEPETRNKAEALLAEFTPDLSDDARTELIANLREITLNGMIDRVLQGG